MISGTNPVLYRLLFATMVVIQALWIVYSILFLVATFWKGFEATDFFPYAGEIFLFLAIGLIVLNVKILRKMTRRDSFASTLIAINAFVYVLTPSLTALLLPGENPLPNGTQLGVFFVALLISLSYRAVLTRLDGSPKEYPNLNE
jgi:hypothetical protein